MIVGEHSHENDLDFNISKEKKLTNIRAAGRDENVILTPPRDMSSRRRSSGSPRTSSSR